MSIPGSGNHVVDNEDDAQLREEKEKFFLPCGCIRRCKCDERNDE
jgi:hypothetical protein